VFKNILKIQDNLPLAIMASGLLFWPLTGQAEKAANTCWTFEFLTGDAYCFRTPMKIHLEDHPDITVNAADYATHPFQFPIYYSIRAGRWHDDRAWELEMVHLKIDLRNKPDHVQRFEVSHGYNLVTVNHAWLYRWLVFRLGLGAVVAHPESTVYDQNFDQHGSLLREGYYLTGPTGQAAVGLRFDLLKYIFMTIEGKLTASYARVPAADGYASAPVAAMHLLAGVGCKF
jgi:hypothetical protein